MTVTPEQRKFLSAWTWVDSEIAKRLIEEGNAELAGEFARSAVHDVLNAEELKGIVAAE